MTNYYPGSLADSCPLGTCTTIDFHDYWTHYQCRNPYCWRVWCRHTEPVESIDILIGNSEYKLCSPACLVDFDPYEDVGYARCDFNYDAMIRRKQNI